MMLSDAEARQRARHATVNVLVEAGAGTGKTTLLVDRVIDGLLTRHIPLSRMLLITFMDKAQEEIRRRLKERLQGLADTESESRRVAAALDSLEDAHITTIHGFCHRLLTEFGADFGVPVEFRVLDETETEQLWQSAFHRWLDDHGDDDVGERLRRLLHSGVAWEQLVKWTRQVCDWPTVPVVSRPAFPDVEQFVRIHALSAGRFVERARTNATEQDAGRKQIEDIHAHFAWMRRQVPDEWPRMLAQWTQGLAPRGNKHNWQTPSWLGEQKEWMKTFREELTQMRRLLSDWLLSEWLQVVGDEFRTVWRRTRFEARALTYDDLVREAERITQDLGVWSEIGSRFDLVMVDEFQDTDSMQAAVIRRLVTPPGVDHLVEADRGRLFLVGDPKQSIYRFRGADVETYATVRQELERFGGQVLPIRENFRSHNRILTYVNGLFSARWPSIPDPARLYVPALVPLYSSFSEGEEPRVTVKRMTSGDKVDQRRQMEAEDIARVIGQAVEEGWPVRIDGGSRPLSYADIALVVPQRTGLDIYRRVFRTHGIPVSSHEGRNFFRQDEIRGLRHLYRALANPDDEVAALGWLLSCWVGLSHDVLVQHRSLGGGWHYLDADQGHPAVIAWCKRLAAWHHLFWRCDAETVFDWVTAASPLIAALQEMEDVSALANIARMRDLCRELGDRWGIFSFSDWLDRQVREAVPFDEAPVATDMQAVSITTAHQAKGLEWPFVIVANWTPPKTALETGLQYNRRLDLVGLRHGPWQSSAWEALEADHRLREEAEADRLLYVALTRARDYLWFYASFLADVEEYVG